MNSYTVKIRYNFAMLWVKTIWLFFDTIYQDIFKSTTSRHCISLLNIICILQLPLLKRIVLRTSNKFQNLFSSVTNLFQFCLTKCRTSSLVSKVYTLAHLLNSHFQENLGQSVASLIRFSFFVLFLTSSRPKLSHPY